jgi:putative ABC transport system ATP-binding protein
VTAPILLCEGLTKRFGDGAAVRMPLEQVSLRVDEREFVAVLGQSGSGKSTLLGILGGLDRTFEGRVELFGHDLRSLGDRALARLRGEKVGFIFQAFHLFYHLTVAENVMSPALFGRSDKKLAKRAMDLLDRLGLADRAGDSPVRLSGGQRQRVAIARALLYSPPLLLCDEPTGNLDKGTAQSLLDLFVELNRDDGITIVAVTHSEQLAQIASRTLHLENGKLVESSAATRAGEGSEAGPSGDARAEAPDR